MNVKLLLFAIPSLISKATNLANLQLSIALILDDAQDFEDGEGPAEPPTVPIDEHILLLFMFGVLLALFFYYNQSKNSQPKIK